MTFALTWCVNQNIFVGCLVTPLFLADSFHYTKKQKKNLYVGSDNNYFWCPVHIGSNWCTDKGVRDLQIAFLKLILLDLMTNIAMIY